MAPRGFLRAILADSCLELKGLGGAYGAQGAASNAGLFVARK
jgi:hypothetical protein